MCFCYSVQTFRGTRSAPWWCEPCSRCVWVRNPVWRSRFQWRAPDFWANRVSSHGYSRDLVLVCMLCDFLWMFCKKLWKMFSGPVGDVPGRSGTGDVSTEVETDVPVHRRRAAVTRRTILLAGDKQKALASGLPDFERSHLSRCSMTVWRFPNMYPSSIVPHWLHVCMIASFRPNLYWSCQHCHKSNGTSNIYTLKDCLRGIKVPCFGSPNEELV